MNEEKRTKLREIEVLYHIPQTPTYTTICFVFRFDHFPFIALPGEGHEVPGWAGVWETTQKAWAEYSGTGWALQGQTATKGIEFGSAAFSKDDVKYRNWNSKLGSFIMLPYCRKKKRRNLNVRKRGRRKKRRKLRHGWKTWRRIKKRRTRQPERTGEITS